MPALPEKDLSHPEIAVQLKGYRLTTAEILYYMPDHPGLLQSFLWQQYDLAPRYPELGRFLDFWRRKIEARVHSVRVGVVDLVKPATWIHAQGVYSLH